MRMEYSFEYKIKFIIFVQFQFFFYEIKLSSSQKAVTKIAEAAAEREAAIVTAETQYPLYFILLLLFSHATSGSAEV